MRRAITLLAVLALAFAEETPVETSAVDAASSPTIEQMAEQGRKMEERAAKHPSSTRGPSQTKRRKKKSWLSLIGLSSDKDDNQPMKLPAMSTEEVLVGVFCIAFGGLFISFAI